MFVYNTIVNIFVKKNREEDQIIHAFTMLAEAEEARVKAWDWINKNVKREYRHNIRIEYTEVEENREIFQG
jgi:hypothetical protein